MRDVLIVEDDLMIADLLQETLEENNYHVVGIARTVSDAVTLTCKHHPDIAVVDIRLALGDLGTDIVAQLPDGKRPAILFSTGSTEGPHLSTAEGDAVLIKPYGLPDAVRAIDIITELVESGKTSLPFPRNFRLLHPFLKSI